MDVRRRIAELEAELAGLRAAARGEGPADLAAWGEPALRRALARHKSSTVLVLGPEDGLVCTDLLPASAESELARIVPHKLDLLTPWPADRVHAAYRVAARRPDGLLELLGATLARFMYGLPFAAAWVALLHALPATAGAVPRFHTGYFAWLALGAMGQLEIGRAHV